MSRSPLPSSRPLLAKFVWGGDYRFTLAALACVLFASSAAKKTCAQSSELEAREEQAFKQAAALVAPAMVRIETVGGLDRVEQVLTSTGPTTGVVVSPDGYVITSSFNFASRPASILVTLADGRRLPATQVAVDHVKMLTLIKVDANNLSIPPVAPRESFRVGQWTIALGRTLDDLPSVSVGIVSALNRVWGKAIQTDAKVSPVNYGGALVDIEGRVMGILVPLSPQASGIVAGVEWYDSGIGFAVPLEEVLAQLDRLKKGQDLFPGLMGISMKGDDIYEGEPKIDRVRYGSPAQVEGLKEGDVLTELDGKPVRRIAQMRHVLGNKYAGEKLAVKVKRGDEELNRELTLVDKLLPYESAWLGILPVREETGRAPEAGVAIRYVVSESPAATAGLGRGERIMKLDEHELPNASALLDLVSRKRPGDKAKLVARAENGKTRDVEVALGSIPGSVPTELRPAPMRAREKELADKELQVGRFTGKMPAHEHEYWAYVPEDYNPESKYGLVVWLHPAGDAMEASLLKAWQSLCDERGLILLAPKAKQIAGWTPDEIDFVKDAAEEFIGKYSIDRARVVLHGFGTSGPITYACALKHRGVFRGISVIASPLLAPPPDNEPEFRTQFHLVSGDADAVHRAVVGTAKGLRDMKYPVVHTVISDGAHKYPPGETIQEIAVWIDMLDRI